MDGLSQRFDRQLFTLKLSELAHQMQTKSVASDRKASSGATSSILLNIVEGQLALLSEWLGGVDRICRDVWQIQGEAVTPDFVREVLLPEAIVLIEGWKGTAMSSIELCAVRTRRNQYLQAAQDHLAREINALKSNVSTKYEIEARTLEHKKAAKPKPKAGEPVRYPRTTGFTSVSLGASDPKPTELPANPPMYFPTDLWPQTNVILLKARRKFPVQTQALELCKLVTAQMTPLFCEAVRAGKMKAGAVQHESGGGMEDLLRLLLIHNDPGPRSGLGLSDQAYRLGEEVRKSDEWLRLGEAIVEAQGNRAETARPRTENKTQEKSTDRRGMVDGYIAQVLARTGKKISRRDIWLVAGYESATEFERFQRNDQRTTQSAVTNFQRVLDMKPDDFIRLLETRKASKNAQPKKAE